MRSPADERGGGWAAIGRAASPRLSVAILARLCAIAFVVPSLAHADASDVCEPATADLRALTAGEDVHECDARRQSVGVWLSQAQDAAKRADLHQAEHALKCAAVAAGQTPAMQVRYDLVRLHGGIAHRREQLYRALSSFSCAADLAQSMGDKEGHAKMLNNSAVVWRRLGDDRRALSLLHESLRLWQSLGYPPSGAALMNHADVYAALGERARAREYYDAAFRAYAEDGGFADMAHVRESMAAQAIATGDYRQGKRWLEDALSLMARDREGARPFLLRTHAALADVALRSGDVADARRWVQAGFAFASQHPDLSVPVDLTLQAARVDAREGDPAAAVRRLNAALAGLHERDVERPRVLEALAEAQDAGGDATAALRTIRQVLESERARNRRLRDLQTTAIRLRVDRDRAVAVARSNERTRSRQLRAFAIAVAATMALAAAVFLRARWKAKLRDAERRARHDAEIARYRRLADELRVDRAVLEASLDSREDALCVVDGRGQVVAANRHVAGILETDVAGLVGASFAERLPEAARAAFAAALEHLDDGVVERVVFQRARDATAWWIEPSDRRYGDGAIFLRLAPAAGEVPGVVQMREADADDTRMREAQRENFRRALVEAMLAAVEAWERSMGANRLELAERSRIWHVSVDDGRLRARTMDRYLSLAKLPQNPHWRDVLRTAYFVLAQCPLEEAVRAKLQERVESVLGYTRRDAMV